MINVGGGKSGPFGPYKGGIQIPIYIFVFGIAGGYLRYLYKTSKLRLLDKTLKGTYIFTWDKVPGIDSNTLKDFLIRNLGIKWTGSPDLEIKKSNDKKTINISDGKRYLSITLNNTHAEIRIDSGEVYRLSAIERNDTIKIYQGIDDMRRLVFYQSLEDLSVIFLAPLLAIATWFILSQWRHRSSGNSFLTFARS